MSLFTAKVPDLMRRLMRDVPEWGVLDAAAAFGNAGHESGGFELLQEIKPVVAGSLGGYGWFQWTGPRRLAFMAWCAKRKLVPASYEANYGFFVHELRTSEKSTIQEVAKADGLDAKVVAFEQEFERAGVKHYPSRQKWAEKALAAYHAGEVPAGRAWPAGFPVAWVAAAVVAIAVAFVVWQIVN